MGCGSSKEADNFAQPGRVLGASSGPASGKASVPANKKITASTPGRTLGSREGAASPDDARSAAAKAAEERLAKANKGGGKLANDLRAKRAQTQNQVIQNESEAERRRRNLNQGTEALNWN